MDRNWKGVWIYANHKNGKVKKSALELLGKGRQLADKLGVELSALLLGYRIEQLAHLLVEFGADRVYVAENNKLTDYSTLPYAKVLVQLIRKEMPQIVLFPADTTGRDLAPRIAARLETGLTADCVDLDIGDFEDKLSGRTYEKVLHQTRPAFGGDIMATIVNPEHLPQMSTVRPGIFELPERDVGRKGEIVHIEVELEDSDFLTEIIRVLNREEGAALEDAKIIVGGGRGVGGPRGFKLIKELADFLGAEIGATRAAVDAGWISYSHQIGLTGQIVKPDLYIACGISGAVQHLVGIKDAKRIIAINVDPKAAIFNVADYCVVGDLVEAIPRLIAKLEREMTTRFSPGSTETSASSSEPQSL